MKRLLKDIDDAIKDYPELEKIESGAELGVRGIIILNHPETGEYERYTVSISFPKCFPKCFPKVIEEGGKIPRIEDRHVNSDNTLCLAVEPEERLICRHGITFKYFLDKVLVPHLCRETYRNLAGKYEDGEYSHGAEGLWEYFGQVLASTNKSRIVEDLEKMLHENWPGRNAQCFCGSSKKFKSCHLKKWRDLMLLGHEYLLSRLEVLKEDLQAKRRH
jgi:hypothetical protein